MKKRKKGSGRTATVEAIEGNREEEDRADRERAVYILREEKRRGEEKGKE